MKITKYVCKQKHLLVFLISFSFILPFCSGHPKSFERSIVLPNELTEGNSDYQLLKLISDELNLSLKYLYTGIGYGNPSIERPGMAKFLRNLSDQRWKIGVEIYQKYVARGGKASDLMQAGLFKFDGTNELSVSGKHFWDTGSEYLRTLEGIYEDSLRLRELLDKIYKMTSRHKSSDHDGDWSLFALQMQEQETERSCEYKRLLTTIRSLIKSPLGVSVFDSNLE